MRSRRCSCSSEPRSAAATRSPSTRTARSGSIRACRGSGSSSAGDWTLTPPESGLGLGDADGVPSRGLDRSRRRPGHDRGRRSTDPALHGSGGSSRRHEVALPLQRPRRSCSTTNTIEIGAGRMASRRHPARPGRRRWTETTPQPRSTSYQPARSRPIVSSDGTRRRFPVPRSTTGDRRITHPDAARRRRRAIAVTASIDPLADRARASSSPR